MNQPFRDCSLAFEHSDDHISASDRTCYHESAQPDETLNPLQIFLGQITGTSVGTHIFVEYGWRADSALSLAMFVFQLVVFIVRGPHCPGHRWFGYEGGLEFWRKPGQAIANNDPEIAGDSTLAVVTSEKRVLKAKMPNNGSGLAKN